MGILGRRTSPGAPAATQLRPVTDAQLQQAAEFMRRLNQAVGNDAALRSLCAEIHAVVGISRAEDLVKRPADKDLTWRWLTAVATVAAGQRNTMLAMQVYGFAFFWDGVIAPNLQWADYLDLCLPAVAPRDKAQLAAVALVSAPKHEPGEIVQGNDTGRITVSDLAEAAAAEIAEFQSSVAAEQWPPALDSGVTEMARAVASGGATTLFAAATGSATLDAPQSILAMEAEAVQYLRVVTGQLEQVGLRYQEVQRSVMGFGVSVAFEGAGYAVISVSLASGPVVNLTVGILRDVVSRDRLRILEVCNTMTNNNAAFPVYLHDAREGWDILMQKCISLRMMTAIGEEFRTSIENITFVAGEARSKFAEAGIEAARYEYNPQDCRRLLDRSLM